jgi:Zn-dependent protease with chaperone function
MLAARQPLGYLELSEVAVGYRGRGFIRTYVFPALFLFALPALGFWFFGHAERTYDERYREAVLAQLDADETLEAEARAEARSFYASVPASVICDSDQPEMTEGMEVCSHYRQFSWGRAAAFVSLSLGVASVLLAIACAGLSFLSRGAQYVSFLVGWNAFRVASSAQVLLQGAIAVGLSYWMTAVWIERFAPKLILMVAVIALIAMYKVLVSIFRRVTEPLMVAGELIREQDAPELWAHVRALCVRLQTEPPAQIIAGIDDNFFVTEGKVSLTGQIVEGRTLFVSLSLLKTLERDEADAVLAHEMAHFSGGDTRFSRKLSPLLSRYNVYLHALAEGGLTLPIFYFMLFYRALFELSLGRTSRQREHRADGIAAEVTGPNSVAKALLKVGAYSSYRGRVEHVLFSQEQALAQLGIPARVAQGFTSYAGAPEVLSDLQGASFPHPFDTHPSLEARVEAVGASIAEADYPRILQSPVRHSWFSAIRTATAIESRMWNEYERNFAAAHDRDLAFRFEPHTPEERAHVEKYFPPQSFALKNGSEVALSFTGVAVRDGSTELHFEDVASCSVQERMFKKYLDIKLVKGHADRKRSLCLGDFVQGGDPFVEAFNRYYGRHLAMKAYQRENGRSEP